MQLTPLRDLYTHTGPFVTVHLDVSRNTEDAVQQLEARWTTARHELEHHGVESALVEEIGTRLHEQVDAPGEVRRTIVAADGRIVFDDLLTGGVTWPEGVTVGELPDLSGWLQQAEGQIPFLLVKADREGADLELHESLAHHAATESEVSGESLHLHKYHGGGWAHRRFQQRSENTEEKNAKDVAEEIRSVVGEHRPRLVLLAGDPRACAIIADALAGVPAEVHQVDAGGRAAGSSEESLWAEVRAVLARFEAQDQMETANRLEERWRQGSGAVLGVDDVLDAFVQGKVETLVVDLQKAHELSVDPSRHPGLVLPEQAQTTQELPADQVLVAAAAATDAAIAVLPAAQSKGGGVAAVLRWEDRTEAENTARETV
jgi:hypothetical protein